MLWNTVPSLNRCFQMMVGLFQIILLPCLLTISQIFCVFLLTTVESQLLVGFVGKARKTVVTTVVTWVWSSFPAFQWLKWRFMSFWRSLTCWGPHQSSKVKYSWIHVKKMEYPSLSTVNIIFHSTMWNRNVQTQTLNAWGWFYLQNWVV